MEEKPPPYAPSTPGGQPNPYDEKPYNQAGQPFPPVGQPYPQGGQPYFQGGQPYPQAGQPYPQGGQPYPQGGQPYSPPPGGHPYPQTGQVQVVTSTTQIQRMATGPLPGTYIVSLSFAVFVCICGYWCLAIPAVVLGIMSIVVHRTDEPAARKYCRIGLGLWIASFVCSFIYILAVVASVFAASTSAVSRAIYGDDNYHGK